MEVCRVSPVKKTLLYDHWQNIKTFVALKVHVSNVNSPRITEIALIAVHQLDIIGCSTELPRITDKLVLSFNCATEIHKHMEANSSLSNENISRSKKSCFDAAAVNLIHGFLCRQERPVCLISHNGYQVDFPVLKSELERLELCIGNIDGDSLLCSDIVWVFNDVDSSSYADNLSLLELIEYSFESLFRRCLKRPIPVKFHSAEDYATALIQVLMSQKEEIFKFFSCRKFACINSRPTINEVASCRRSLFPIADDTSIARQETETFVFMDLETTSLTSASITELCMISIHRNEMTLQEKCPSDRIDLSSLLPRIRDEIRILIDPVSVIETMATSISGIVNSELEKRKKQPFTYRTVGLISSFLSRQAYPVCLVAYNGIKFDFKILREHIRKCKSITGELSNLFCADAWKGILELTSDPALTLPSYKLENAFQHLSGASAEHLHTAEGDTKALIAVTRLCPNNLPAWLDQKKEQFL